MARTSTNIDEILRNAVADVVRRIAPVIQRQVATYAAEQLERNLAVNRTATRGATTSRPRRARGEDLTRWVADRNARRVPNFVIEATGLDTKKQIVARYGENATFEKGKPLPAAKAAAEKSARTAARESAARVVTAKQPVAHKRSAR
jgi:hypothetical protein